MAASCDGAIVQTDYAVYREIGPDEVMGPSVMNYGRGVLDGDRFAAAGIDVVRIGAGAPTPGSG